MAAGGLINQMFNGSDMPGYQQADLSPTTQALINQQNNYANQSVKDYQKQRMAGVQSPEEASQASLKGQEGYNAGLGLKPNEALNSALQQRTGRMFSGTVQDMQRMAAPHAYSEKLKAMQSAYNLNEREGQINLEQAEGMRNADLEKRKARNSTVAGMIGGAAGVVGAIFGGIAGGPGGAMKGQQVGSGVGGGAGGLAEGD